MGKNIHTLVDNGLLGAITKRGHYQKYVKFCEGVESIGVDSVGDCDFIVTPASLLEAIGVALPEIKPVIPELQLIKDTEKAHLSKAKEIGDVCDFLRLDVLNKYESILLELPELKIEYLESKVQEQLKYVDPALRDWFYQNFSKNLKSVDAHSFICNRLALDRMYSHKYPKKIASLMDSTTIIDIVKSIELEHNLPQARGLEKLWGTFKRISEQSVRNDYGKKKKGDPNTITTDLTQQEIIRNIRVVSGCFKFKTYQDLLDLELIHFSTVGRMAVGKLEKVFCFTADPKEKTRIRIQMMKSFLKNSKEIMAPRDKSGFSQKIEFENGIVGFFDRHGVLQTSIEVADEPYLFDRINLEKIIIE